MERTGPSPFRAWDWLFCPACGDDFGNRLCGTCLLHQLPREVPIQAAGVADRARAGEDYLTSSQVGSHQRASLKGSVGTRGDPGRCRYNSSCFGCTHSHTHPSHHIVTFTFMLKARKHGLGALGSGSHPASEASRVTGKPWNHHRYKHRRLSVEKAWPTQL